MFTMVRNALYADAESALSAKRMILTAVASYIAYVLLGINSVVDLL